MNVYVRMNVVSLILTIYIYAKKRIKKKKKRISDGSNAILFHQKHLTESVVED